MSTRTSAIALTGARSLFLSAMALLGLYGGLLLDKLWGTDPGLTMLGLAGGIVVGFGIFCYGLGS
ncbi:MAG: hypothetical protein WAR22_04370 [Desulfomonilia bacterium]